MEIDVKHDLQKAMNYYRAMFMSDRDIRFAMALAMTRTIQATRKHLQGVMRRVFDRPKPITLNGMYIKTASKQQLRASVGLKDKFTTGIPIAEYLHPQITGGGRKHKGFEGTLKRAGILPAGMFAMPGVAAQIDAYGNMSRSQIQQIKSSLRIQSSGHDTALSSDKGRRARAIKRAGGVRYFARKIGDVHAIWMRHGNNREIIPVIVFTRAPSYRQRFDFMGEAQRYAHGELPKQMVNALHEMDRRGWRK